MRIAIFSDNFYPELSGIADSIIILAKELAKLGHKINFYVPRYSLKDYRKVGLKDEEIALGESVKVVRFFSLPYPTATGQARLVLPIMLRTLFIKKFDPDIIHSQLFFGAGLEALIASRLLKKPIIGTNHTAVTEFIRYSPIKTEWFKKFSLNYLIWYYNHCDYVTAPAQSIIDEMVKSGLVRASQVISNPIDLAVFNCELRPDSQVIKKEFNLSAATVVYAGRLAAEKSIEPIIRAIALVKKEIPEINLALAGHGSSEKALKDLAKKLGIEANVKFLGTLDKPTLARLYQASEIFVIMSTSEVQNMCMLQAMACGLPLLGVSWRGVTDLVGEKNGYLVAKDDYRALAEKIIFFYKNNKIRQACGQSAFNFVSNYSSQNVAKQWEKLYLKVIEDFKKES